MHELSCKLQINQSLKYVEIETCNLCTRKCSWCLFGSKQVGRKSFELLEDEYIYNVLNDLKEIGFSGTISLYSINEPLLDNRIKTGSLISETRRILGGSVAINLITNGDLLDLEIADTLFACGLNNLNVSCYDNKTYDKITEMRRFNNHIKLLDQRRYSKGSWESNRAGFLYNNDENPFNNSPCYTPYFRAVIGWDGNVRICPHDMCGSASFGNIKNNSFLNILNSKEYTEFRTSLSFSRKDIIPCKDCNVNGNLKYALSHLNRGSEVKSIMKQLK